MRIVEETAWRFRIEPEGPMRVPGVVFVSKKLLPDIRSDKALEQVANVATLPGIVLASYAMPDVHWGYGFPIGGVAAMDVEAGASCRRGESASTFPAVCGFSPPVTSTVTRSHRGWTP
jgi:tRNA-splicing ligase RtcB (3'-phosphate/5'-hydroxy nucleic acid ligase)